MLQAEQVLAKSNQIISGQPAEKKPAPKTTTPAVKKTGPVSSDVKEVRTSRLSTGAAVKAKPVHMNAPFKTQPLNLFGNKRPLHPVKRPSVAKTQTRDVPVTNKFVRSNSASSVVQSSAVVQPSVPERKSLANPSTTDLESSASQLSRMVKDVRIGHVNPKPKVKAPQMSSQEKARRENQLLTVKNIQNSLRDNLDLKRKVLLSTRKPSTSRAIFMNKVQSIEAADQSDLQAAVCSTSVFKVHQSSVLYQRLGCLVQRELMSSDPGGNHDNQSAQKLRQLLDKMKQADRLISKHPTFQTRHPTSFETTETLWYS